jgi:hypothetical protein
VLADLITLRERGIATLDVALDMTTFFDHMHRANDILDRVPPADFHISATAYAVVTYLATSRPGGMRDTALAKGSRDAECGNAD